MKIKDKIAIGLIILSIVLFGLALNGLAYDINDKNLDDLAYQAANDSNGFMSVSVNDWTNKTISPGAYKSGNYKSGICMYHVQSNNGGAGYKITDVLDFSFDGNGIQLNRNGYAIATNDSTGALAKTLYTAYSTGEYYNEKNWGSTGVKENVIAAFSQAVQQGGVQAESTFYSNIRNDDKGLFNKSVDKSYGASAKNYKSVTKNLQDSAINVQHEIQSAEGYTMIGPFNINFAGKGINQIGIYSDQKEFVNGNGGGIYYSTYYKTIDGAATRIANGDQGWSNTISNIPSGVDFYIIVSDKGEEFSKGNNLRVTIYQESMEYYHARLVLAQNPKAQGQNMGIFAAEQKYYTGEQTFNITKSIPIDLTVVKSGNNNVKLSGVNFRLSNGNTSATWGNKQEQNGIMVYSNITFGNWEDTDRQIFTTGSTGRFIVKDLDVTNIYSLQETWNPNKGYGTVDIKNATLSNGVASVGLGNTVETNRRTNNLVTGIKLSSTQANILEVIDRREEEPDNFNIVINKTNLNGKTLLGGAQFKVKVLDEAGEAIGWLEKVSNTKYNYDVDYEDATTWSSTKSSTKKDNFVYADTKGEIEILDLSTQYQYEIYETKQADSGYALSSQITSYSSSSMSVKINDEKVKDIEYVKATSKSTANNDYAATNASIYCGVVSYEEYGTDVEVLVTNRIRTGGGGRKRRPEAAEAQHNIYILTEKYG